MAYVAVDGNGVENIFSHKPIRQVYLTFEESYWSTPILETKLEQRCIGNDGLAYDEIEIYGECFELPKGSIKKLIGRELTWDDEPVELTESINEKICSECGKGQTHHKIMFFLKERAYLGTEAPHGMSPELYRKSQYDFGFDYSISCRVKKKQCECGNEWYEKAD